MEFIFMPNINIVLHDVRVGNEEKNWIFMAMPMKRKLLHTWQNILIQCVGWQDEFGKEKKKKPFTIGKKEAKTSSVLSRTQSKLTLSARFCLNNVESCWVFYFYLSRHTHYTLILTCTAKMSIEARCSDNMGNEVNLWRCIPQMKFHFMNESTNGTHILSYMYPANTKS